MKFIWNEFENILPISNPGMAKTTAKASDSDDSDDLPELVDCTDDEVTTFYQGKFSLFVYWWSVSNNRYCLYWTKDSGEEEYHKRHPTKAKGKAREKPAPKAKNNG